MDTKIAITLPYNVGDYVWLGKHEQFQIEVECSTCLGDGYLINKNGLAVPCGSCYGHKTSGHTKQQWHPVMEKIHSIQCYIMDSKVHIERIYFEDDDVYPEDGYHKEDYETFLWVEGYDLSNLFDSKIDCEKFCEKMNRLHPEHNFG